MDKWDWSAIFTGFAVVVSLLALWLQRKDLKKQAVFQRNTFELQNLIQESNLIINISSEIVTTIMNLALTKQKIPEQIVDEKRRWKNRVNGMRDKNSIFHEMTSILYDDSVNKLRILERNVDEQMIILRENITRLSIHKVVLNVERQKRINKLVNEFFQELSFMDEYIDSFKKADSEKVDKNSIQEWAQPHIKTLTKKTIEFQDVFIEVKTEYIKKVEVIKKED
ncbi:hypothetical protein [Lactococcus lactis]|uniref:hypothetical protein n=1 Tax=Lactococcus lactis TaxID=1358 RepID=UPI0003BA111E|nr:hypothetical protein [Lactococcus lactis]AGY45265.1 hypothetical protein P620_01850 [Lactococcus lactis subsp. lactis KLDS 4.0325]KHE78243.1 hypothetical protein N489_00615 [Lactococcus lactis subsp. lactis 1AA59]MBG1279660.1 hypothetical protein [Lactococcus lactis subsp. lactis]MDM7544297.1 hypothetical protein [Lactococcus lactis]TRW71318.1 hypothetical protein FNJ58_02325 [Lactococcus lactis]